MPIKKHMLALASSVFVWMMAYHLKKRAKRTRRFWCKPWTRRPNEVEGPGVAQLPDEEKRIEDPHVYQKLFPMTEVQLNHLLDLVESHITRQDTNMREAVTARHRLQITLRFLATGESYKSLMVTTRVHNSTIGQFVPEVCNAIYLCLKNKYLKIPNSTEEWEAIGKDFQELWQFPNCIGALDGRHITFRAPLKDGSYYNYKGTHSIVLLAMADAKYRFTYVNVGTHGCVSDDGVFDQSGLAEAVSNHSLNLPPACCLPGRNIKLPHVIITDDAFTLSNRLLKPYSKCMDHDRKIFNYRLSEARRTIESAFGILANRFRVLMNPIYVSPEKVETITLACVVLHNFLIDENPDYLSKEDISTLSMAGKSTKVECNHKPTTAALKIRDEFKDYFVSGGKVDILNHNM